MWSGSEELWYRAAVDLLEKGFNISVAVNYENEKMDFLKKKVSHFIDLKNRYSRLSSHKRITNRIMNLYKKKDLLINALQKFNPDVVVISQGNNISSISIMEICSVLRFSFITITQLVAEVHFLQ